MERIARLGFGIWDLGVGIWLAVPKPRGGLVDFQRALHLFFEVLQPGVKHFLDAMQLGTPEIAHIIEAAIDCVKSGVDAVELIVNAIEFSVEFSVDALKFGMHVRCQQGE